jgi:membrane associated rhomboid family serine protease
MSDSGFRGFTNASVTKLSMVAFSAHTFLSSIMDTRHMHHLQYENLKRHQYHKIITKNSVFSNSGSLIFSLLLLYQFRILERQRGSSKFICYIITIGILSSTFETLYIIITNSLNIKTIIPSGPYGIIASTLYLYYKTVPVSFTMKVLGITFSDKFFSYLLAFQLYLSESISTLPSLVIGIISGILYNLNILGIKSWRFPILIRSFFKKYIAPIVDTKKPRSLSIPTQNTNVPYRAQTTTPNEEYIKLLKDMGFKNEERIKRALIQSNNDPTR